MGRYKGRPVVVTPRQYITEDGLCLLLCRIDYLTPLQRPFRFALSIYICRFFASRKSGTFSSLFWLPLCGRRVKPNKYDAF